MATVKKMEREIYLIESAGRAAVIKFDRVNYQFVSIAHNRDGSRNVGSNTERGMEYAAVWQSKRAAAALYRETLDNLITTVGGMTMAQIEEREIKFFMRAAIPFVVLGITLAAVGLPFTSLGFWIVLIPTAVANGVVTCYLEPKP